MPPISLSKRKYRLIVAVSTFALVVSSQGLSADPYQIVVQQGQSITGANGIPNGNSGINITNSNTSIINSGTIQGGDGSLSQFGSGGDGITNTTSNITLQIQNNTTGIISGGNGYFGGDGVFANIGSVSLTNQGTIDSKGPGYSFHTMGSATSSLNNSGSMTEGIGFRDNSVNNSFVNSGVIRTTNYYGIDIHDSAQITGGIQNTGTINGIFIDRTSGVGPRISGGISNYGTISSSISAAIKNTGTIDAINNYGNLFATNGYKGIDNTGAVSIGALRNLQGFGNSNGALTLTGKLPTNYVMLVDYSNGSEKYGRLIATSITGTTTFGIAPVANSGIPGGIATNVLQGISLGSGGNITTTLGSCSGAYTCQWQLIDAGGGSTNVHVVASINPGSSYSNASKIGPLSDLNATTLPIFEGGTLRTDTPNGSYSQNFTLNTSSSNTIDQYGNISTFSGIFSNATTNQPGNIQIVNTGSGGSITFTGANTYTGTTTISSGTLVTGSANTLPSSSAVTVANGAQLNLSNNNQSIGSLAGAGNISLGSATLTTGNDNTSTTYSGVMSGTGGVTKVGSGTFVLASNNTYTGPTTISAGTLQIGTGGTVGSVSGDIVNNANLVINRSDAYNFTGVLSGNGSLTVTGGGAFNFAPAANYSGPVNVTNNVFTLGTGSSTAASFTLGAGAVLKGNGTIGSLAVNNGGTISPGNSPGTINVNGPVNFGNGSTYQVDVTPSGAHDLITSNGSVTISNGAAVQIAAEPGRYRGRTLYPIITTSGSISGTFGSVSSDYAFLIPSLSYDSQNVFLTLLYTGRQFSDAATTPNQIATATAIQQMGFGSSLFDSILPLTDEAVPAALKALSGEIYPSTNAVIQNQSIYVRDAVNTRLGQAFSIAGNQSAKSAAVRTQDYVGERQVTVWGQIYDGWGNNFGNYNASQISNSIGGFILGADANVVTDLKAGLFGGFSKSRFKVDAVSSSGTMDNYDVGLYTGGRLNGFLLKAAAAYGWHDITTKRNSSFTGYASSTSAGYNANTLQLFGEVAYDLGWNNFTFQPFLGLAYLNIGSGPTSEIGGSSALSVKTSEMNTGYSTLGLRTSYSIDIAGNVITPSFTLGWQHAFGDITPSSTMSFIQGGSQPFNVFGTPIAKDAMLVEAGIAYKLSDKGNLALNYSAQFAPTSVQNALTARFSFQF